MKKRIISLLLVVVLVFACVPVNVFATGTADATINVDSVTAAAGATVDVNVKISGNPGIAGATFTLTYHEDLTLTKAVSGTAFIGLDFTQPGTFTNPCNFTWDSEDAEATEDGVFLTLTFQVADTAEKNAKLNVDVSYRYGDVFNNDKDLTLDITNGNVVVLDYIPGDVYEDGVINSKDTRLIRQYIAGGYDITINEAAADVNDDGVINAKDTRLIRRFIAGGYDVVLLPSTPKCEHSMTATNAKDATCTEDGNIAYWYCADCAKYFSDAEATNEIAYIDTVISAAGHTPVVDEAVVPSYTQTGLTEGSHCGACGEVIVAQETVPMLQATYHAVIYRNLQGAESPAITQFAEHEGVPVLPEISLAGYQFKGWYTEQDGGTQLTAIPTGCTQDMELWARWEIIEYTITYDCGKGTNAASNVATYTINDLVIFSDPTLAGYLFNGWVDENGTTVTRLHRGTTGNILLTANWITNRNLAHPIATLTNPLYEAEMHVQSGDEYSFIYYLGYIENVPFGWTGTPYYHNGLVSYSKEHSTSEATSDSITTTTSKVTEDTHGWQSEISISSETEIEFPKVVTEKITVAASHNQSGSHTTTEENGKAITISQEYVSASTESANITPESSPVGWYRYVNYATIDVFATITYNVVEDKYYVSNFNAVRDITTAWDYSAKSAAFDDETYSDLPFTLPDSFYEFVASLTETTEGLIVKENGSTCTIERYLGTETVVNIPSYYKNTDGNILKVVSFNANAFSGNTSVTSVSLGQYITEIPTNAFNGCTALESVTCQGKITTIGEKAFAGCANLDITLPESLQVLGANAFDGCEKIDNVVIPASLSLGTQAFANCGELQVSAAPTSVPQLDAIIHSGATTLNLDLTKISDSTAIPTMSLPDTIKVFTLTGNSGHQYNFALSAKTDTAIIKNITTSQSFTIHSGQLTLVETSIAALQFAGDLLLLQGKVTLGLIKSTSKHLTISPTAGNMAELISNGGILASGDLTLSGVMDATITGTIGNNGIQAANLTIDIMGILNVSGGQGTTGSNGTSYDRTTNAAGYAADGRRGGNGGVGGTGKSAIACEKLTILNAKNLSLSLSGGKGGTGGKGGNGEFAGYDKDPTAQAGNGGTGGAGGTGGVAISAMEYEIDGALKKLSITSGDGGNGGNGGNGGHSDEYWVIFKIKWGLPGNGGSAGAAGAAGSTAIDPSLSSNDLTTKSGAAGKAGTAGSAGVSDYY